MSSPSGPSKLTSQTDDPSSNFKSMLDAALIEYKKKTGEDLQAIWLASELQTCESVDSVLDILRNQASALERSGDRQLMKWIDPLVHVLYTFSGALGDGASLAFPPAKVIFTGIGVLLGAAKDARVSHGAVIGLFERIESFFKRLEVYNQISLTTKMAEVLVKIVIELLSILSIATKEVRRRRSKLFARKLLGRTDIEDALKRLDRLIQEEFQMVTAQILKVATEGKDGSDKANITLQQVLNDMEEVKIEVVEVKTEVVEVKSEVQEVKWAQIEKDVHKWFSPPDPYTNYNIACEAQSEGTAAWFFQSTKFKVWMSNGSLLWIHGKPGSGKSILCSAIIKHFISLRDDGQASLAFFYFDFRDEEKKQDHRNFVTSLLCQLSANSNACCEILSRIYSTHGKGTQQPGNDVLKACLLEMLSVTTAKPIYIIVDALDECPDVSGMPTPREAVLNFLEDVFRLGLPNLYFCVTSRPEVDIKTVLGPLAGFSISLHDEGGQVNDISDYVTKVVYSDKKMGRWRGDEKELVVEELSKKADGMFRWVFCQLEVLRHCLPGSIRQILEQLPESLDDTYLRVLRQIPQANQTQAHCMLQCLVVAVRPLSVAELAELLAFDFDAAQGGIPKYRPTLRLDDQTQAVLSTCSSLVTIIDERRSGRQVVQFSHFSVKEFLVSIRLSSSLGDISRYHIRLGSAHTILTQACLGLLLHPDDDITKVEHFPLARYAAEYWVQHAQFEDVASRVKDGMEILFKSDKPHFKAWVRIYDIDPWEDYSFAWEEDEYASPLYYSVLCGFYDLVDHLASEHSGYVNKFGGEYEFPLLAALGQGRIGVAELLLKHGADVNVSLLNVLEVVAYRYDLWDNLFETVKFLLKHGADVNARDDTFTSPLHWAAANLKEEEAMILLNHKADVNSQNKDGKTPMHLLLESDMYDDIYDDHDHDHVRLLLEHGAKVNIRDTDNRTPFLLALDANRFSAALIFLEHGAHFNAQELNRRDKHNNTLLHWAILVRNFKLPRILLQNGADANAKNDHGQTPLHVMSESDIKDGGDILNLVLLLLKHDAAANSRDVNNETPLHLAIERNRCKLAEILLEHDADADAENIDGETPLHTLSESDSIKDGGDILNLVLLLLKHGAAVNSRSKNGRTPLHLAVLRNRLELAKILLENGADAGAETNDGHSPLHVLSEKNINDAGDILNLVQLLLKHGAAVNSRSKNGCTPLHLAVLRNRLELTEIFLEHGADASAENNNGQTPLHMLSESDIEDGGNILNLVLLLLKHGAEVNGRTMSGKTPLHRAIQYSRFKLAEILLEHGADAGAENNNGQTPLHVLSESDIKDGGDILDLVLLLLKHGAAVNSRSRATYTPLHLAIQQNQFKLAEILLEHGANAHAENKNGRTPLHLLSRSDIDDRGDILNLVLLLLKHGVAVNDRNKDHETALHLAIRRNRFKLAGILLEHSADAHAENKKGQTPLRILSECWSHDNGDFVNHAKSFLAHVMGVNLQDEDNTTSLVVGIDASMEKNMGDTIKGDIAVRQASRSNSGSREHERSLALALESGVDLNVQEDNQMTLTYLQSNPGPFQIAVLLLYYGAIHNIGNNGGESPIYQEIKAVNVQDQNQLTPLHLASLYGWVEMARVLLDRGATVNSEDNLGQTPLHMVSLGDAQDHNYATPLDFALHHGKLEIESLLLRYGDKANAKIDQGTTPSQLELECTDIHERPAPST